TLALGVGANTAVFGIIHGVLLSPLPYRAPDELVAIAQGMRNQPVRSAVSPPNYLDIRAETKSLADAGAYYPNSVTLTGRGTPVRLIAPVMTPSLFSTLAAGPVLGRTFTADEGVPGRDRVAILSYGFWLRHFGGERSALGTEIRLDGENYTIVGVMPKGFSFPIGESDLWLPLGWDARVATQRGAQYLYMVGRRRAGTPIEALRGELETLGHRLEASFPDKNLAMTISATPLAEQIVGDSRPVLLLLAGAVALVILIASSNVANLLLARVTRRSGEFAVRAALGAGRARLMRQLAAESLLLGVCGAVGGLVVGWGGVAALKKWWPAVVPRQQDVGINLTVAAFALGIALTASLVAALVPSWRMSWAGIGGTLRRGGRGDTAKGHHLRHALVSAELALALMLLTGAMLLLTAIRRLEDTDPGFERRQLVTFQLSLPGARYADGESIGRFFDAALDRIRSLPGVTGADAVFGLPLIGFGFGGTFNVEGPPTVAGDEREVGTQVRIVTADYFRTMGIPIRDGRGFEARDRREAPRVLVVSASVARHFWPNGDAIGRRLKLHASPGPDRIEGEIVGVVGDVRAAGLHRPPVPIIYSTLAQTGVSEMSVVMRTTGVGSSVIPLARDLIRAIDPEILVERAATMEEVIAQSLGRPRFAMDVLGLFSALGVALAIIGIYGVVAYSVSQRTREIGVRMALGADPRRLVVGVVGRELVFVVLGVAAGGVLEVGLTPLLSKVVYGLDPAAPSVMVAMAGLLFLVAALAVFLPARRAARIDPVTAIRTD
ncbi:MAG: ABC transporter permease, partial [Gemmatimonadota bacterium]